MQNVFIINLNSLYEILDEIKENLYFKIIKFENEHDFNKNHNLDKIDFLIISKINPKLLLNKKITDKNFLDFDDLPLSLKKLLELINIKLIKLSMSTIQENIYLALKRSFITQFGVSLKDQSYFSKRGKAVMALIAAATNPAGAVIVTVC